MSFATAAKEQSPVAKTAPTPDELAGLSLADYATNILRDRLIVLDIAPGAPMNDELIGRELGIGRTPVREAIKRLESEHLITVYPRRGTFAATVDITDLAEVSEIRAQLEPLAASRAATYATPSARAAMRALAAEIAALDLTATDAASLMRYDLDVHRSIYAANGNKHLEEVLIQYDNLATRIWCVVLDRLTDVGGHVGEHVELLGHVADGAVEASAALAFDHVTSFERMVRSVI